ncbi:hypothetical protein, partial [Burkholderia sp. Tr-860]|uniref:hypothetical protein n=1 Tax=Burkholderia sp. Tr-860 TaxID=2608338 RepID=UPI0019638001
MSAWVDSTQRRIAFQAVKPSGERPLCRFQLTAVISFGAGGGVERVVHVVEAEAPDADHRLAVLARIGRRGDVLRHLRG